MHLGAQNFKLKIHQGRNHRPCRQDMQRPSLCILVASCGNHWVVVAPGFPANPTEKPATARSNLMWVSGAADCMAHLPASPAETESRTAAPSC